MKRRLSDREFAEVQNRINESPEGMSYEDLIRNKNFLLDLSDMVSDPKDQALYLLWAGQLDKRIGQMDIDPKKSENSKE